MLFNSFEFIFFFLPVTLVVFFLIGRRQHYRTAISWLILCSLFFYGWWNPAYLMLILFSMLFNYLFGVILSKRKNGTIGKPVLAIGITVNLALLGYFKYANFFVDQLNSVAGTAFVLDNIILPLAISFFTFQQVAYLVDAYRRETSEYNFLNYCLFVTFFPQLIAGPIVHHKEMLPQFAKKAIYHANVQNIAIGLLIFIIGLFKKVIIADSLAGYATPVFAAAEVGSALTFFEAWTGALAYTFQLYFDFSGYSDMAIGIGRMFGIKLPVNFNSPYKASSIIDFWRRWHITLSRFLRDYLYFPLGGNKKGPARRHVNLFITMLLGGLWHGAGWTFVIWGMLHGFYLIVNHAWRKLRNDVLSWPKKTGLVETIAARTLTLVAVIIGWVYFRAESLQGANHVLATMLGLNGISLPIGMSSIASGFGTQLENMGILFTGISGEVNIDIQEGLLLVIVSMLIALVLPNSQQLTSPDRNNLRMLILNNQILAGTVAGITLYYIFINLNSEAEFLYFNF